MGRPLASSLFSKAGDDSDAIKHAAAEWKARADAGLNAREEAELREWLAADPRHRAALARFDLVWDKFDRPFRAGAADQLLEELEARAARRRRRRAVAIAAGLAVVASGATWQFALRPGISAWKTSGDTSTVLLLPEKRTLPDGSIAELKAGAEITIAFTPHVRQVSLRRGEVHFQVKKDPSHPFVVLANGVETRAVGTAFAVEMRPTAVEVLVTEGKVSVAQVTPASPAAPDPTAPAQFAAVLDVGKIIVVEQSPQPAAPRVMALKQEEIEERLAWRAPRVEFTRASLSEAVAILNNYSAGRESVGRHGVKFVIGDPELSDVRISGLFRVDKTEAFVALLHSGFAIDAEPRGDAEIVLRRAR